MKYQSLLFIILLIQLIFMIKANFLNEEEYSIKFIAKDRNNKNYNNIEGILHKKGTDLKGIIRNMNVEYYYNNGRVLFKKSNNTICVDKNEVPPFDLFLNKEKNKQFDFQLLTNEETFDKEVNKCNTKRYLVSFAGENFIVCEEKNNIIRLISENFIAIVEKYDDILKKIEFEEEKFNNCKKNEKIYLKNNNIWFENDVTCDNKNIKSEKCNKIYRRFEKKYTCIFFHGNLLYNCLGVGMKETKPIRNDSFEDYWGNVHEHTPQCDKRYFIEEGNLIF
jgi:hypothetical protein